LLKSAGRHAFADFTLDREQRTLTRSGQPVEINSRYFDALALMVERPGELVGKDRFMDEVWRGVPVTDEALTQCIRSLRKLLGDDAARPRFIETVPKHGYRFIAPLEHSPSGRTDGRWRTAALLALAGTVGGGIAGLIGGTIYGLVSASNPLEQQLGGVSVLLVMMCVSILIAALGAAGVASGIAAAQALLAKRSALALAAGGAVGGLIVGLIAKLLMVDSFRLLVGESPGDVTGALEGAILGGAVGFGAWAASRSTSLRRTIALAAASGALGGIVIALLGRPLMAGSLAMLAERLSRSRLSLDSIAALAGEQNFGPLAAAVTATLEGALFAAFLVLAMRLAERDLERS
jgi:DNA-binding winged helix-turn-helix (wHTH) protein